MKEGAGQMSADQKTRVYHVVKFSDGSAYLFFNGCTWNCVYCVARSVSRWCLSLSQEKKSALSYGQTLTLNALLEMLVSNGVHTAFLGGEEPTYDPAIFAILKGLVAAGIKPWLITNGELINDRLISLLHGMTFSIKAITPSLHLALTGKDNAIVLANFKKYANPQTTVAETVLFPGLVDCNEIYMVAKFVEYVNPQLRLRVDLAVQAKQYADYLRTCVSKVKQAHKNTYYFEPVAKAEEPVVLFPKPVAGSWLNNVK